MAQNYIVRYGSIRHIGEFSWRYDQPLPRNTQVVVKSPRGKECGEILSLATAETRTYLGSEEVNGKILRTLTIEDQLTLDEIKSMETADFQGGCELIKEHKLQMQLVDVERLFGGDRLIFYFLSEKRVDFRELVKSLAKKFQTRIEMRQIGVRDEAKLLADYGDCGKPVCCNTHLREMPPVSMKMAKVQKATLDPTKISGRCGRLKCCLRYEYDTYEEYRRELPNVGAFVVTREGEGKVLGQEILARKIVVDYGDRRILTDEADVLTVVKKKKPDAAPKTEAENKPHDKRKTEPDAKSEATKSDAPAHTPSEKENPNKPED